MSLPGLLLALALVSLAAQAEDLPEAVHSALRNAHIPLSAVGIEVRELDADKPLISINADQAMNPASTMKLLTSYAGLELLGPAYTWKTEAYLRGRLEDGILNGDLILKGYGDPGLTMEQFWLWLRELRNRGLREIQGDLILDRSAFQPTPYDPAEFDSDPLRAYNVGPDALLLNFNALRLRYIPDGDKVNIITEPALAGIPLVNRVLAASQGGCSNWSEGLFPQIDSSTLLLKGSFPTRCGEREQFLSLLPHTAYMQAVFHSLWQELGGKLDGNVRDGSLPPDATLFSTHSSPSLSEQIRSINKFSNNVMARQLFLTLSLVESSPATIEHSKQIVRTWLNAKGLSGNGIVLDNGAGLSRNERISAHDMAMLLQAAQHSPFRSELEASLPIAGMDGTLRNRLLRRSAAGHAHLKTGTLAGVKTVAGYVQNGSGKLWVLVFFINHVNAIHGQAAQDALIELVTMLGSSK